MGKHKNFFPAELNLQKKKTNKKKENIEKRIGLKSDKKN